MFQVAAMPFERTLGPKKDRFLIIRNRESEERIPCCPYGTPLTFHTVGGAFPPLGFRKDSLAVNLHDSGTLFE